MKIVFDKKNNVFLLRTKNTEYALAVVDGRYVEHLYYGKYLDTTDLRFLLREDEAPLVPSVNKRETGAFLDCVPMEYPESGMGDYRESALCVRSMKGHRASELVYEGYEIVDGKPKLEGLPAVWGSESECMTLKIFSRDSLLGMKVTLLYSVLRIRMRSHVLLLLRNEGETVYLEKVLSACLDMDDRSSE